ncbi:terminase [Pseudoxanthomonas kalamensis DSM 18571]|nr:terminase [Pseudoxanthomonas kalamensis DSM 18571]
MVAGFGAGKTHAAILRLLTLKLQYPIQSVAYYLPTYDLVTTIAWPRVMETLESWGLGYKQNKNDKIINVEGAGSIIFRTMDAPERIIGYEVADSIVDELDTLPEEKAAHAWNKIIARNRQKKPDGSLNTVGVATTPEGFRFVYDRWVRRAESGYRIIKAGTMSNAANLPTGYIDSLRTTYPPQLLAAYLDGEFVNLVAGSVYPEFDRAANASAERIKEGEALHVGMDFNVGKMSAVIHVLRGDDPHAVVEHTGVLDTPAMAALLSREHEGHKIIVYPDASGASRKSNNASESDLAILRKAGFGVRVNPSNPRVKDRVLSVNKMICSDGARRYRVNPEGCPDLVESLEKQAYDKHGEPDKSGGLDHVIDAAGYFIAYRYPIKKPATAIKIGFAA